MRKHFFAVVFCLLASAFLLAQDNNPQTSQDNSGKTKTVQGCVSRSNGDYVLMKQNPGMTYELQGTHRIKLRHYLGKRVEVTGETFPSMMTSSDSMAKTGAPSSVTLRAESIKILDNECSERAVPQQ